MSDGLARNFLFLTAGNVLAPIFSMVLVLAISRLRGMELLGQYSLIMTVFVAGQSCASLGLPVIVTREVARDREHAGRYLLNATLVAGTLVSVALLALMPAAWRIGGDEDMRLAMSLTLLTLLPSVLLANCEAVLLALGRAGDFVSVALGENVTRAGVGTVLVVLGFGIVPIAAALLVLHLLASVVLFALLHRRDVTLGGRPDRRLCRMLLREVPVVGAIPLVNQLYARSDVFLLTWLGTWREVGLYSAGLRLVDVARMLPAAYGRALYPILARQHGGHPDEFAATLRRGIRQVLLLVAPVTVVLGGFASVLIPQLFGPDAVGGASSLAVLAYSLVPLGLACVLAQALFAAGRQSMDLRVNVIAIVFSVVANLVLIPGLGALGAAIAMLASTMLYAALQYWLVRAHVVDPKPAVVGRLIAVSSASMACAVTLTGQSLPLAALLAGMAYLVGIFLSRVATLADIEKAWGRVVAVRRSVLGGS